MNWLLWLLVACAAIALAYVLWHFLQKPLDHTHKPNPGFSEIEGGHSVWCYRNRSWSLLEDKSTAGYVAGPPPDQPGEFDGACVKVRSVKDPRAR
jgi:hypothetical protein